MATSRHYGCDEHLRSGEFFDVENHPTMTFEATGVSGSGSNYELAGDANKDEQPAS